MMTSVAILIGAGLVGVVGLCHHHALYALGKVTPDPDKGSSLSIQATFLALLLLHVAEILAFSAANQVLLHWDYIDGSAESPLSWADIIYLTGVNFTTLGYTQIKLDGDIRIVTMLQSLGGFMLLTWSATYLFTVCQKSWKRAEED